MRASIAGTLAALACAVALALAPTAGAANCGRSLGARIVTNGAVSCKTAKRIYRLYRQGGRLPRGWTCGLSARACFKGSASFTFGFNG